MLETVGVKAIDDLFADIPVSVRLKRDLQLPPPRSEMETLRYLTELSRMNGSPDEYVSFLGAGAYAHFVPSVVKSLTSRGEFATAYTPYQPEIAQGTLQAIFEFQTLICQLTDMDAANASMYDGASAVAEAVLMAQRVNERSEAVIASALHPDYRRVVNTYTRQVGIAVTEIGAAADGGLDLAALRQKISANTSCVVVQYPNFFGVIEALQEIAAIAHEQGALLIVAVAEPVALGLLAAPGTFGADIVVGEAQAFGNPVSFGGPYIGFFAIKSDPKGKIIRKMPGRLVGETTDADGKRGFVLTLSTREQHIKREKATSNICSNEALCALAATIHLSLLGKTGLKELARRNFQLAEYAKRAIAQIPGYRLRFSRPTFNEFAVSAPRPADEILRRLLNENIIGGVNLTNFYPELGDALLICVTEQHRKEDIDRLVRLLTS